MNKSFTTLFMALFMVTTESAWVKLAFVKARKPKLQSTHGNRKFVKALKLYRLK